MVTVYMTCREMSGNGCGIGMALFRIRLEWTMQGPRQALTDEYQKSVAWTV